MTVCGGMGLAFNEHFGMSVVEERDGEVVVELEIGARHLNSAGIVHGGTLCSLADTAIGMAVHTLIDMDRQRAVTAQLSVSFLRAVSSGRLRARGVVTVMGRRLAHGEGEITSGDTVVAKAHGVWYVQSRTRRESTGEAQTDG